MKIRINTNDKVRIKLTDLGRKIHREWHDDLYKDLPTNPTYIPPKEDADGWSEWQLWCVMHYFGSAMWMGAQLPFETEIEF